MRRRDGPALLPELAHHRQSHGGIGSLMAAQQGHLQVREVLSTPVKMHAIAVTRTRLDMPLEVTPSQQESGVLLLAAPREDLHDFGRLWSAHHTAMWLDDAGLFAGNRRQSVP